MCMLMYCHFSIPFSGSAKEHHVSQAPRPFENKSIYCKGNEFDTQNA